MSIYTLRYRPILAIMKCPNCKVEDLLPACWVPHLGGAFVIFECKVCDEVFRVDGPPRKTSGTMVKPVIAKVTQSDAEPETKRSRRRAG